MDVSCFNGLYKYSVLLLLVGCTHFEPTPQFSKLEGEGVISHTASVSGISAVKRNSDYLLCKEPPPDAVFTQEASEGFSFSLISNSTAGEDSGESIEEHSGELEMQGRTPAVLITRELMYRLCEMTRSHNLQADDITKLYDKTLDLIHDLAISEAKNTKITLQENLTVNATEGISQSSAGGAAVAKKDLGNNEKTTGGAAGGGNSPTQQYQRCTPGENGCPSGCRDVTVDQLSEDQYADCRLSQ